MKITYLSWGKIIVDEMEFKDIKIWPGTMGDWDWNETGTRHLPGIQIEDFIEFIEGYLYPVMV